MAMVIMTAIVSTTILWMPYSYSHSDVNEHVDSLALDENKTTHNDADCDHCCHFASHVVAIVFSPMNFDSNALSFEFLGVSSGLLNYESAPPGPPPKPVA